LIQNFRNGWNRDTGLYGNIRDRNSFTHHFLYPSISAKLAIALSVKNVPQEQWRVNIFRYIFASFL
jgi:hypothetical protein